MRKFFCVIRVEEFISYLFVHLDVEPIGHFVILKHKKRVVLVIRCIMRT